MIGLFSSVAVSNTRTLEFPRSKVVRFFRNLLARSLFTSKMQSFYLRCSFKMICSMNIEWIARVPCLFNYQVLGVSAKELRWCIFYFYFENCLHLQIEEVLAVFFCFFVMLSGEIASVLAYFKYCSFNYCQCLEEICMMCSFSCLVKFFYLDEQWSDCVHPGVIYLRST